jgi:hypothetical protein
MPTSILALEGVGRAKAEGSDWASLVDLQSHIISKAQDAKLDLDKPFPPAGSSAPATTPAAAAAAAASGSRKSKRKQPPGAHPAGSRPRVGGNEQKWCTFHKKWGHSTEECRDKDTKLKAPPAAGAAAPPADGRKGHKARH